MPKQKTIKGAVKRFRRTGTGALKRAASNKRHILTKKPQKRKRQLRGLRAVNASDVKSVESMLCIS